MEIMKIEAISPLQNSFVLERRSNSSGRLSSNGQGGGVDSAVIGISNQQNLQLYDDTVITVADNLSETVSNIQTLAQNGQNLDGIHDLDLERVLRLIS
jgi:hypothetical protein